MCIYTFCTCSVFTDYSFSLFLKHGQFYTFKSVHNINPILVEYLSFEKHSLYNHYYDKFP